MGERTDSSQDKYKQMFPSTVLRTFDCTGASAGAAGPPPFVWSACCVCQTLSISDLRKFSLSMASEVRRLGKITESRSPHRALSSTGGLIGVLDLAKVLLPDPFCTAPLQIVGSTGVRSWHQVHQSVDCVKVCRDERQAL